VFCSAGTVKCCFSTVIFTVHEPKRDGNGKSNLNVCDYTLYEGRASQLQHVPL